MANRINIRFKRKSGFSPRKLSQKPLFAFFAVFSLCLQLIIPLEQSWASPPQNLDSDLQDYFVICTPSGLRILSLNSDDKGQPIESSADLSCSACSLTSVTIAPQPLSEPILRSFDHNAADSWFVDLTDLSHDQPAPPPPARGPPLEELIQKHTEVLKVTEVT